MSDWLKLNQVAEHLGVSSETVRRLVARGELLGRKIGGVWKIHKTALAEYERPGLPLREQVKREGFIAGAGDELAAYRTSPSRNGGDLPRRH